MLGRAMGKPTPELYLAAIRVLNYVYHHRSVGLRYGAYEFNLIGMSEADLATRHSTSGLGSSISRVPSRGKMVN